MLATSFGCKKAVRVRRGCVSGLYRRVHRRSEENAEQARREKIFCAYTVSKGDIRNRVFVEVGTVSGKKPTECVKSLKKQIAIDF